MEGGDAFDSGPAAAACWTSAGSANVALFAAAIVPVSPSIADAAKPDAATRPPAATCGRLRLAAVGAAAAPDRLAWSCAMRCCALLWPSGSIVIGTVVVIAFDLVFVFVGLVEDL